jgi:hypothetical protein
VFPLAVRVPRQNAANARVRPRAAANGQVRTKARPI